jgi:hypothetical protein
MRMSDFTEVKLDSKKHFSVRFASNRANGIIQTEEPELNASAPAVDTYYNLKNYVEPVEISF